MPRKYKTDEERRLARRASLRRYYLKNREKICKSTALWSKKNSDRVAENLRNWRKRNRERAKQTEAAWLEKNIDKARATRRRSYHKHSEKRKAKHREWVRNNLDVCGHHNALRRVRCKLHPMANKSSISMFYSHAKSATKATGIKHVVDHIIPVAASGWHHEDNLQIITKRMNESKHGNPFWISPHVGIKDWRDVPRDLWPVDLVPQYLALIEKHKGETIRWDLAA